MRFVKQALCALVPLAALTGVAAAQDDRFPNLFNIITGSVPQQTQSDQWSGQPGASGHPLMQPDQILAAVADFKNCLERMWPDAARRGISRASFDTHTAQLEPDIKIMDFVDAQPEFTRAFWEYLDLLVTDERLTKGREILTQHANAFAAAERTYGVDRHIIAAIWGIETKYGAVPGDRPVIRSTATLACVGRRQAYFKDEFLAALEILHRGDIRPEQLKGSWAGAFGLTQFMPTAFKRYAIDFDGDGRRDVVGSVPDVIASTANHLAKAGWLAGHTWGYEVALPQGFNYMLADPARRLTLAEWARHGVQRAGGERFPRHRRRRHRSSRTGGGGTGTRGTGRSSSRRRCRGLGLGLAKSLLGLDFRLALGFLFQTMPIFLGLAAGFGGLALGLLDAFAAGAALGFFLGQPPFLDFAHLGVGQRAGAGGTLVFR